MPACDSLTPTMSVCHSPGKLVARHVCDGLGQGHHLARPRKGKCGAAAIQHGKGVGGPDSSPDSVNQRPEQSAKSRWTVTYRGKNSFWITITAGKGHFGGQTRSSDCSRGRYFRQNVTSRESSQQDKISSLPAWPTSRSTLVRQRVICTGSKDKL
jgi:hypothetical protein